MRRCLLFVSLLLVGHLGGCESKAPERHAQRGVTTKGPARAPASKRPRGPSPATSAPPPTSLTPKPSVRPAGWATGPMSSLLPFAQQLARAAQLALVEGKPVDAAFAPFSAKLQPKLRGELAAVKAKTIELMGMELELVFYQAEKAIYYLRTFVFPAKGGPEFFKIDGRVPAAGKLDVPDWPLSTFTKIAPELAKAADGLAGVLRDGRCKLLPIVTTQSLEGKVKPGPMLFSLLSNLRQATLLRAKTCDALPALDKAQLRMRVDDFSLVVLGANEKVLGTLHGELSHEKGALKVDLARFRLFP